jgi:hypothetical protein
MLGQRWPGELTPTELHALVEKARGGPDWAPVADILLERGEAAAAARLALEELAREKRDPFAARATTWWLTKLSAGLLGSSEVALARQFFEAAVHHAEGTRDSIEPVRLVLLRELAAVRAELPDDIARVFARGIESGDMNGAELELAGHADRAGKKSSDALRRLLRARAPTLSSYYEGSVADFRGKFREPWYRRMGGSFWLSLVLLNVVRMTYGNCIADTPRFDSVEMSGSANAEKALCEETGPLCDAAFRWSRAGECAEMRAAFLSLEREYMRASKLATPSMRQQLAYAKATRDTNAHCPSPLSSGARE